jgi:cytochrome oxidase Cu insertion factor (SCO1/SenC/PrrC family)
MGYGVALDRSARIELDLGGLMRRVVALCALSCALSCALLGCSSEGSTDPEGPPPTELKKTPRKNHVDHKGGMKFHEFKGQEPTTKPKGKIKGKGVTLVDAEGKEVELSSLLGKPMVLVFMRGFAGSVCPYCTTYTPKWRAATRSSPQLELRS